MSVLRKQTAGSDALAPVRLFASVLVLWLLLNGSFAPDVVAVGLAVSALIVWAFSDGLSFLSGYRFTPVATLGFIAFFVKELVKANLAIAALVLRPSLPISPAIVKVRTRLTHPVARLLLANAITLTPGTLTVEIKGEWFYIHWLVAKSTDPEAATQEIVAGFERYLEVMYG